MTWIEWLVSAGLGMALFVAGGYVGWTFGRDRGDPHFDVLFGAALILVAVAIAADTINLQIQFHRHIRNQMACIELANNILVQINTERRVVDGAAKNYDTVFEDWLRAYEQGPPPMDLTQHLLDAINQVEADRAKMIAVYDSTPPLQCDHNT